MLAHLRGSHRTILAVLKLQPASAPIAKPTPVYGAPVDVFSLA